MDWDWVHGVSRCWILSRTCGIDWEAWSAIGAVCVGLLAWRTAVQAKATSETATEIARQQHEEVQGQRDATARILARLLVAELSTLPEKVESAISHVREARQVFSRLPWPAAFTPYKVGPIASELPTRMAQVRLDGAEVAEPRLHTLPPALGNQLSLLMSLVRGFHVATSEFASNVTEENGIFYYKANREFDNLRSLDVMLMRIYKDAVSCAQTLQGYVGMTVGDYPELSPTDSLDG